MSSKKGTSTQLTTLNSICRLRIYHKGVFRHALCLGYGWHPENSFPLVVFMTRVLLLNMPQAHREDGVIYNKHSLMF